MKPLWFEEESTCIACPLHVGRKNVVPGVLGSLYDGVFLVGEAPGPEEDHRGVPWIGPAGQFLQELLENSGLNRDMFYMVNITKCWPHVVYTEGGRVHEKTIAPKAKWALICLDRWFMQELARLKPHTLVLLGSSALKPIMGASARIGAQHGRVFEKELIGYGRVKVIPLYHPAAKMHQPALESTIRDDFAALPGLLDSSPEPDRGHATQYTWIRRHQSPEPFLEILKAPVVSIDTETYMEDDMVHASHARLLGISVSDGPGSAAYIDSFHKDFGRLLTKVKQVFVALTF